MDSRCRKTRWSHVEGEGENLNGGKEWEGVGSQEAGAKTRIRPDVL